MPPPLVFPIRLRCATAADLTGDVVEAAVTRALGRAFTRARQALPAARATGGGVVLSAPELLTDTLPQDVAEALLAWVGRAIARAAEANRLPLAPTPRPQARAHTPAARAPASRKKPSTPWRVRIAVEFTITPRNFFAIRRTFETGEGHDPSDPLELYFPVLDQPMPATAWVVEVAQEYPFTALTDEVIGRFGAARKHDEFVWAVHGWGRLRALTVAADRNHVVAAKVPDFGATGYVEHRPGPTSDEQQTILRPGAWILSLFLPLPNLQLADLVSIDEFQAVEVPLGAAGVLLPPDAFRAVTQVDWDSAVRVAADLPVPVYVTPFTVRRKVHERTLAALFASYRREAFPGTAPGTVVPFTPDALAALGPALAAALGALPRPGGGTPTRAEADYWLPGATGLDLALSMEGVGPEVYRRTNAALITAEADEAQRVVGLEDTWVSADREPALVRYLLHWENERDAALFPLVLDELGRRGALDAFLAAVRGLRSTWTALKRIVVRLAAGSGYAADPRITAMAEGIETLARNTWKGHYDVAAQEVWINGDPSVRVHAAGDADDDARGVVAEVAPYFAEASRTLQPKPEVLDRLREPTRKKVSELIGRMVCKPGEKFTREQLLQKAMQEAANELSPPIGEQDLIKVTLRKSVRVLRLESRVEAGIQEIYVHYQPVQKVGDNPWMPAGDVIVENPMAFEAYLTYFHVQHLMDVLTVFVLAETVVLGGVMIIELGIASIGQLFFFVGMQMVVYWWTTDAEDRTVAGYLTAALRGELDAVGFKILSGAVKSLGGFVASQLVTRELVSEVATKWIVFGLRGVATAAGVAAMEVTFLFAADLLRYSHCQGWSSPGTYWDRFTGAFWMTLLFEFVAVPVFAPPLRRALEKAGTIAEAATAWRAIFSSSREAAEVLIQGASEVEAAIARTVEHEAGEAIRRGFRLRVSGVLKALGREYEARAYSALLELYGPEISGAAAEGLRRMLATAGEKEIDAVLQRMLAARLSPVGLLRALGAADEAVVGSLLKAGKLAELGASPRVLGMLTGAAATGSRLLAAGPFRAAPAELERYLGQLEPLGFDTAASVLRAIANGTPVPPEIMLQAARQVGALDDATVALLRRLHDADVRMGALFDGSGPTLDEFRERFGALSEAEQAAALERGAGRTPADVLTPPEEGLPPAKPKRPKRPKTPPAKPKTAPKTVTKKPPAEKAPPKRPAPGAAPQLPPGVNTGPLRRKAMEMIGRLARRDREAIVRALRRINPEEAGEILTALGRLGDVDALAEAIAMRRSVARVAKSLEGPGSPPSSLDDAAADLVEDDLRIFELKKPAAVSATEEGVSRGALKARMRSASPPPGWAASPQDWNPHHMIPVAEEHHPVLDALRRFSRWDHNAVENGIALPTRPGLTDTLPVHQATREVFEAAGLPVPDAATMRELQGHPMWNQMVRRRLDALRPLIEEPSQLPAAVDALLVDLRREIETAVSRGQKVLL